MKGIKMDNLTKLRYWTFKILPLVYDDSLSYYEVLAKVTNKVNELVDSNNTMPQAITNEITKQLDESYATDINNKINSAVNTVTENANNQIDKLANEVYAKLITAIATDEGTNTFTKDAKSGGELIFLNNTLYKVTAVMPAGTNYIIGTNIIPVDISKELKDIKETYLSSNNEYWNERSTNNYDTGTYLYWKDVLYIATKDIKINDILYTDSDNQNLKQVTLASEITNIQKQIYKLAQETSRATNRVNFIDGRVSNIVAQSGNDNTEIVDGRTGYDGTTYDTLGTAIRTQITNVNDNLTINYDLCSKGSDNLLSTDYMIYKGALDADTGRFIPNQSDGYYATPFIRIKKNDTILYTLKSANPHVALIALYDNSMNYQNAIATGQSSGVTKGYYTATADGYIRVSEYPSAFPYTGVTLGRYIATPGEIETFNTAEIKDLREYLKYKGIIDNNGLSRYDAFNGEKSSYYYTPYILCSKNSILEYYLTLYNTDIAGISIYDQNKNLLTAICGDNSGIEQGALKVNAGNYVRMCLSPQSTSGKGYIYAEDCANDKSFNERFFEKTYIKKSNGVQIYNNTDNYAYSVTPFIHVNLGDIVNYRLYSYNADISLITLYDSNLSFVKSIAYGSPSNLTSGNYTFNSDGYIKVCSYGYTYSKQAQFAQTNSSALMPCDIDKKNPTVLPTLTQANSRTRTISSEYWKHADIFTLLHFSDIHADYANIDRIVKYKNYLGGRVAAAVCTGDMVRLKYSEGFDWWRKFGAQAVLTCIGNHDCTEGSGSYMQSDHTQAELYAQYIEPFLTYWNEPDTAVSSQENKSYYYKDYTYYKIRLIAINDYLTESEATEQNAWLQTALADAIKNGYSVIILTHQFGNNLTKLQCTFTSQSNIGEDSNIEAYKSSVQSFIENGGDFVCWLCGHKHTDYILKSTVYPTQLFLCVTTAQANEIETSEAIRPYGDKAQDAFNLISIDRTSKIIKIVRVGQDKDWMLRRLETLVLDYKHATVISNN